MQYEREFTEVANSGTPVDELIAWARQPESRLCWPGAGSVRRQGSVFYFNLDMQAPGAPAGTGVMEEYVGGVHEAEGGGSEFDSMFTLTWPSGEVGSGQGTYRFTGNGAKSSLSFTLRYVVPKKLGIGNLDKKVFLNAVDRALSLYTSRLANGPRS